MNDIVVHHIINHRSESLSKVTAFLTGSSKHFPGPPWGQVLFTTVASNRDLVKIAEACGYPNAVSVSTFEDLDSALKKAKDLEELSFIEVKCSIGARDDLGRPTTTALENKQNFMKYISEL